MLGNNGENKDGAASFNKEDAYKTLEMANSWISNIDTKVSFALAFSGGANRFRFWYGLTKCTAKDW